MYEELYNAWENEREEVELKPLPKDFYIRLIDYFKKMLEEMRMLDNRSMKAKLMKKELENAKKLVEGLMKLRYEKIIRLTMAEEALNEEALTMEEGSFYKRAMELAELYRSTLKNVLQGRLPSFEAEFKKERPRNVVVRFMQDVPTIIGVDMKAYGPFKSEDVATLPIENARALIKRGAAVEVELHEASD